MAFDHCAIEDYLLSDLLTIQKHCF